MAFRSPRSLALAAIALLACQRLEVADDGGALTFSDTTGTTTGGESSSEAGSGDENAESNDTSNPTMDCDPILQTGCSPDQKCTAVVSSGKVAYVCVMDAADLDPFESCTASIGSGADDCSAGYVCIADEFDAGVCEPLCLSTNDCANAVCINEPLHNLPYCASECSPFEGGCVAPTQCRRTEDRFACSFPHGDDVGGQGDACSPFDDAGCGEGFVCFGGSLIPGCTSDSCCTSVCDLVDDTCDLPSSCTPLFTAPAPGSENIGVCVVAT